jgi:hypothetical protein
MNIDIVHLIKDSFLGTIKEVIFLKESWSEDDLIKSIRQDIIVKAKREFNIDLERDLKTDNEIADTIGRILAAKTISNFHDEMIELQAIVNQSSSSKEIPISWIAKDKVYEYQKISVEFFEGEVTMKVICHIHGKTRAEAERLAIRNARYRIQEALSIDIPELEDTVVTVIEERLRR